MSEITEELCAAVAAEVYDSCVPYVVAARSSRLLPKAIWYDPYVNGFIESYCLVALQAFGVAQPTPVDIWATSQQVISDYFARFDGTKGAAAEEDEATSDKRHEAGVMDAYVVLKIFAGDEATLQVRSVQDLLALDISDLQASRNPPPTRLHPAGAHSESGRRAMLSLFTRELMELDRKIA